MKMFKNSKSQRTVWLRRLLGEEKGVAALEFAIIAPLLMVLFLGAVAFSQALTMDRRVTLTASSLADLVTQADQVSFTDPVTQADQVSTADLDDIMLLGDQLMQTSMVANYDPTKLIVKMAQVTTDANGNTTVDWSYDKSGGTPYASGSSYPGLPASLAQPNMSIVATEVSYDFEPIIGHFLTGPINLEETFYLRPRRSVSVQKVP